MNFFRALLRPPWLYLILFLGIGLLIWLAVGLPYTLARQTATQQAKSTQAAAQQARSVSSTLLENGQLGQIQIAQVGPAKTFANGLQEVVDNFVPVSITSPLSIYPPLLYPGSYPNRYVAKVNTTGRNQQSTINETNKALKETKKLLVHQSNVTYALVNILSYNPALDFANFKADSADTKHRLELAANGLNKTHQTLTGLKTPTDPTIQDLILAINNLEIARKQLASSGDITTWQNAVNTAQTAIISNRTAYWNTVAGNLAAQLSSLADKLNAANDTWTTLSSGKL